MLALLAILAATPATLPAPSVPTETITVTGTRLSPAAVHERAVDFVRATGVAIGEIPAARWAEPVCPRAVGLAERSAASVEAKLRTIAADANIPIALEPCTANIAVMFTADPAAVVKSIAAKSPRRVAEVPRAALPELINGAAPIRWWYTTEVRDRSGIGAESGQPPSLVAALDATGVGLPGNETTSFVQHYSTSIVSTENVRVIRAATVVIDAAKVKSVPLDAVIGYAALVAFAEMRRGAVPPGSVLGLFTTDAPPSAATAWDIAFLRALYRLPLDRTALRQRGILVTDLVAAAK